MKICPNCNTEQPQDDVRSCYVCGYLFDNNAGFSSNTPSDDDSSDFVVKEAYEDDREFVGGHNKPKTKEQDNDLEIETNSDIMEHEAINEIQNHSTPHESKQLENNIINQPIGDSSPPPPLSQEIPTNNGTDNLTDNTNERETSFPTKKIEKLSDEKIKQIEQNLYHSDNYLSDKEKKELISKIDNSNNSTDKPSDNTLTIPSKKEKPEKDIVNDSNSPFPEPKISKKSKGIAYFYKNYIQLMGRQELLVNDELTVNKQTYLLKPKKIKPIFIYAPLALIFVIILFIIGSFFIANVNSGQGQVFGLVLNENNQPYIEGAIIRFTDLGKSVKSNPQGFFLLDDIPVGTQKIEYIVKGHIVKKDFVTITSNNTSMVLLRPQTANQLAILEKTPVAIQEPTTVSAPIPQSSVQKKSSISPPKTSKKKKTTKKSTYKKSRKSKYAKVTLAANIDGARFKLDGSVLGAGNLTYSKIKTGTHNYSVSLDGYKTVKGKIKLSSGQNKKLVVTLKPLNNAQKEKSYQTDDYYFSGKTALENGNYKTAVSDLTEAIKKQPSSATAYFYRGKAHLGLKNNKLALDDFLQAADIYQFKKEYNKAITCYNQAIKIDNKSVTAYLGRGNAFYNQGEELAALADYDKVTKLDRRNFQAYFGLGKSRFQTGQYKRAIKNFKDARSIDHNNPYVLQYMMLSYLALDDYKNVKKSFNKFKKVASEDQMKNFKDNGRYAAVLKIVEKQ